MAQCLVLENSSMPTIHLTGITMVPLITILPTDCRDLEYLGYVVCDGIKGTSNLRLFMLTMSWGRNASQTGYKTLKDIKQVGSMDT